MQCDAWYVYQYSDTLSYIIQSCIHRGLTPKLHVRLEKQPERKYSRYLRCPAPFLVFAPGHEADWLTYILDHLSPEPKGTQQKRWPMVTLSSSIFLYNNILAQSKFWVWTYQWVANCCNLIQIVTMRSIKQHRRNHCILVREELLQSSFFLSSCFMATMWRVFLVTSCRLLKTIQLLDIQCIQCYRGSIPAPWFEALPILPWGHPCASWRLSSSQVQSSVY